MRKHRTASDFTCFIRNVTPQPVALPVPFGQMEGQSRMSEAELEILLSQNPRRVAEAKPETAAAQGFTAATPSTPAEKVEIKEPELL
jgi:hypothetical protein